MLPSVERDLGVSAPAAAGLVTAVMAGLGPAVVALAFWGRRRPGRATRGASIALLIALAAGCIGASFAPSLGTAMACGVLMGAGAAAWSTLSGWITGLAQPLGKGHASA